MTEYEHLVERKFQNYAPMHQAMYKVVVELLRDKPASILDIGFGIGYGLEQLLAANCISEYTGVESDKQSFEYVFNKFKKEKIFLCNYDWVKLPENLIRPHDFTLCIEVIEHIDQKNVKEFLAKLAEYTSKYLFLSTPDKNTDAHGLYTKEELRFWLGSWGFTDIVDIEWQLPHTLFICKKG